MRAEIRIVQADLMVLYQRQRTALLNAGNGELQDIVHDCEELIYHRDFTVRTAAEINRAAATIILEERR